MNDIATDMKQQKKKWIVPLGWIAILVIILFTALGVSGNGPFRAYLTEEKNPTLEYEHFLRAERETRFKLRLDHFTGETHVAIPENYLKNFNIHLIYPSPQQELHANGNIVYIFNADDDQMVSFYMIPRITGLVKGSVLIGGKPYTLSHFVYPR